MLKTNDQGQAGEIVDAAVMSAKALSRFVDAQIEDAKAQGVLFSLHLKATMMKVSDPIMFGVVVERFYRDVLAKHVQARSTQAGFDPNNGIGDLYARLPSLPDDLAARRSKPTSPPSTPAARRWRWSTPTRASPTCTCRAT